MNIYQILLAGLIISPVYGMEPQPDSILACVTQAKTFAQACDYATSLINKQSTARKITTERFLLECQKKFHRSMYEVGFYMAIPESFEIASDLAKEATQIWKTKPKNKDFAEHLFAQNCIHSNKVPSFLYYTFMHSPNASIAHIPLDSNRTSFTYNVLTTPENLSYWVESGLLINKQYVSQLYEQIICICLEKYLVLFRTCLNIKELDYNMPIYINNSGTLLEYAMKTYTSLRASDKGSEEKNQIRLEMIRLLVNVGAKSAFELQP